LVVALQGSSARPALCPDLASQLVLLLQARAKPRSLRQAEHPTPANAAKMNSSCNHNQASGKRLARARCNRNHRAVIHAKEKGSRRPAPSSLAHRFLLPGVTATRRQQVSALRSTSSNHPTPGRPQPVQCRSAGQSAPAESATQPISGNHFQ
jgi:hypothetical protein